MKKADGIAAAAHAGHQVIGEAAGAFQYLAPGLPADNRLEIPDHHGKGMGAHHRADAVMGVVHAGHPVAQGLIHGVLEGTGAGADRHHLRAQQFHAEDVQRLAAHVYLSHVHLALQPQQGGGGGRGHAVLSGARLGDDPSLAHVPGEQALPQGVVYLVGSGMAQVLPLEEDGRPSRLPGQPAGLVEGGGPARVVPQQQGQLLPESIVPHGLQVGLLQLEEGSHQRLGDVSPPEVAEVAALGDTSIRSHGDIPPVSRR